MVNVKNAVDGGAPGLATKAKRGRPPKNGATRSKIAGLMVSHLEVLIDGAILKVPGPILFADGIEKLQSFVERGWSDNAGHVGALPSTAANA